MMMFISLLHHSKNVAILHRTQRDTGARVREATARAFSEQKKEEYRLERGASPEQDEFVLYLMGVRVYVKRRCTL